MAAISGVVSIGIAVGDQTHNGAISESGGICWDLNTPLAAGLAGRLTTRTSDSVGVITLASGHGITGSDVIALQWATGRRRNITVSNPLTLTIDIEDGEGDVLPADESDLVVCKEATIESLWTGNKAQLITLSCDRDCQVRMCDDGDVELLALELLANSPYFWCLSSGLTNPVAGDSVAKLVVSAGTAVAGTLKGSVLLSV
jgi:hypothetical protein